MYSEQLLAELGLLNLSSKGANKSDTTASEIKKPASAVSAAPALTVESAEKPNRVNSKSSPKLDKNEFRLLVKMLKAINHDCVFDAIIYDGQKVSYQMAQVKLVFSDINQTDSTDTIHLSSLKDLLADPALKRPVWEKLKSLRIYPA